MRECRFCHCDLAAVPRTEAMTKHIVGLCAPSHTEVESAIAQLEIEEEREKEAIRKFWDRERERPVVSGKDLLLFMGKLLAWSLLAWLLIVGWFSL